MAHATNARDGRGADGALLERGGVVELSGARGPLDAPETTRTPIKTDARTHCAVGRMTTVVCPATDGMDRVEIRHLRVGRNAYDLLIERGGPNDPPTVHIHK